MWNLRSSITPPAPRGFAGAGSAPRHPDDVLADPALTAAEKREILAGWASDDHAVRDAPGLRQLDDGAVVAIDEILRALRVLDLAGADPSPVPPARKPDRRRRPRRARLRILVGRRDDDDDPPPSPAAPCPLEVVSARRSRWESCGDPEPATA